MKLSKTFVNALFLWSLVLVLITLTMPKYSLNSQAIIVCFITWFFVGSFKQKWELFKTRKWLFFIASSLFWVSLFGLLYTENMEDGLKNFQKALPFFLFPLLFSTVPFSEAKRETLFRYFSIGVLITSAFGLAKAFYFKFNNLGDYFYYDNFALLLDKHTTYFALFAVFAILFFLNEILKNSAKHKLFNAAAIVYLLAILYLLSARVSVIALIVGCLILFLFYFKKLRIKKLLPALVIILVLGIAYATPNFQERFYAKTPEGVPISGVDTRTVHWKSALQLIGNNNLLIGAGTGDGHLGLYEQYLKNGFKTGYINQYNAHNQFLESTLYYGIVGLLALIVTLLLGVKKSFRNRDVLAFATVAMITIFMCTESILERHSGIVFVSFMIALMLPFKAINIEKPKSHKLNKLVFLKNKKKILMIGPYSAVGGVSVHIKRLATLLKNEFEIEYIDESPNNSQNNEVFNIRSFNIIKYFKIMSNANIIHIHSGVNILMFIHVLMGKLLCKKIVVTYHAKVNLDSKLSIILNRFLAKLAHKVVSVSEEIKTLLNTKKSIILPAFIPPKIENEPQLPQSVLGILKNNKEKKIIASNAFRLDMYEGEDLYGCDLMVEVARKLKRNDKNHLILFVIADIDDKFGLFDKYQKIIISEGLRKNIILLNKPLSFVRLINHCDLVVRPTNTDGDALTIREALFYKIPVIASNVTKRPIGTILFKNRDSEALYEAILTILKNNKLKNEVELIEWDIEDYREFYKKLYINNSCEIPIE